MKRILLLTLFLLPLGASAQEPDARLTNKVGKVYIRPANFPSGEWAEAEAGTPLQEGDAIRTDNGANAEISLDGDTVVLLNQNSEFKADSLKSRFTKFFLSLGSLTAKIRKLQNKDDQFQIRTPVAVAAVRGTELAVDAGGGESAVVGVFDEGQVAVQTEGHEDVVVNAGEETEVATGAMPIKPRPLEKLLVARPNIVHVRERIVFLKPRWQALPPAQRREFRARLLERPRIRHEFRRPDFQRPAGPVKRELRRERREDRRERRR
jgi:hypothetical protein